MTVSGIVTLIAALVIILRLLTYRRRGSRYRPGIGVAAWASIAACSTVGGGVPSLGMAAVAVGTAVLVLGGVLWVVLRARNRGRRA